jgi:hypothetical protein
VVLRGKDIYPADGLNRRNPLITGKRNPGVTPSGEMKAAPIAEILMDTVGRRGVEPRTYGLRVEFARLLINVCARPHSPKHANAR